MKKGFLIAGVGVLIVIALIVMKVFGFGLFVAQTAEQSAKGVITKTLDSDNVLFNYENFHDLYQGAKQQAMNIENVERDMQGIKDLYGSDAAAWTKDVRSDYQFKVQTREGYLAQYQNIASRYNSNSKKLNRNLFKDKGLPYEIPLDYKQVLAQ